MIMMSIDKGIQKAVPTEPLGSKNPSLCRARTERFLGGTLMLAGIAAAAIMVQSYIHKIDSIPDVNSNVLKSNPILISAGQVPLIVTGALFETERVVPWAGAALLVATLGAGIRRKGTETIDLLRKLDVPIAAKPPAKRENSETDERFWRNAKKSTDKPVAAEARQRSQKAKAILAIALNEFLRR